MPNYFSEEELNPIREHEQELKEKAENEKNESLADKSKSRADKISEALKSKLNIKENNEEQKENKEEQKEEEKEDKQEKDNSSKKEIYDDSKKEESKEQQKEDEINDVYNKIANKEYKDEEELKKLIDIYWKDPKKCDEKNGTPLVKKINNNPEVIKALNEKIENSFGHGSDKRKSDYLKEEIDKVKTDNAYELIENLFKETNDNVTDQDKFWLPDMGEFYLGNVDTKFLEKIDKAIRDKKDALTSAHYSSLAPQETLGYDEKKKMHFLRFTVDMDNNDLKDGMFDGNHLRLSLANAESSEDDETGSLDKLNEVVNTINRNHYFDKLFPDNSNDDINIDIVGITCPKVPKWCTENNAKMSNVTFEEFCKADISADKGFIFVQEDYDNMDDGDKMKFVRVMGTWRQAIILDGEVNVEKQIDENKPKDNKPKENNKTEEDKPKDNEKKETGVVIGGLHEGRTYSSNDYRIVDGDTIAVKGDDGEIRVRLIGVNTPESVASDEYLEKTGKENSSEGKTASDWVKEYMEGKSITLEFDTAENESGMDKYNRPLAYVFVDGKMLNLTLIEVGLSRHTKYKDNTKYLDELSNAEKVAKENNKGFWATLGDTNW